LEVTAVLIMVAKHCGTIGNHRVNKSSWVRYEGGRFTFEVQTRLIPSEQEQNTSHVRVKTDF
jgi:hypothetical protein